MKTASQPMSWDYPRFIAHRCGGALAPENTLAGLGIAARLGHRAVEFDTMLSADGIPVVIHDETLERTTDRAGQVATLTAAELGRCDAGIRHHRAFAGETLPTLDAVLAACLKLGLAANVEIKPSVGHEADTGRIVAGVCRSFIERQDAATGFPLLLSSFSPEALETARVAAPILPRALLVEDVPDDWPAQLRALDCIALHCEAGRLLADSAARRVRDIVQAGVPLACYTVNRPEMAVRLFSLGVRAVFTDRLDLFDPAGIESAPVAI